MLSGVPIRGDEILGTSPWVNGAADACGGSRRVLLLTGPGHGAVTAALLGVAWLACWVPAARAARVKPTLALQAE